MAGSQIERVFSVLERLTGDPRGLPLQTLAEQLEIPKSATHRLLAELIRLGYVRQNRENSRYQLSAKLVALGFRYLASNGADIIQPILDRLAQDSGELVRLLPRWTGPAQTAHVVHAPRRRLPARVQAVMDYLVDAVRRW